MSSIVHIDAIGKNIHKIYFYQFIFYDTNLIALLCVKI